MKTAAFPWGASPFLRMTAMWWRYCLGPLLLLWLATVRGHAQEAGERQRYQYTSPQMGALFYITVYAPSEKTARRAADAAFQRVDAINAIASDYLPESELSRFNRSPSGEAWRASGDFFGLFRRSMEISSLTDGAFDVTAAYAVQHWRRARRKKALPAEGETQKAIAMTDWRQLELVPDAGGDAGGIVKRKAGLLVDLGGIGKGYAADAALKVLREHGLGRAVVAASGDLALGDPPPDQTGWDVALRTFEHEGEADRLTHVRLSNVGCSTSGDLHQYLELGGKRYSHIVNPRTGLGLTERIACTVVARDAAASDALATAFCVMGVDKTEALVKARPDLSLRVRMTWMPANGGTRMTREWPAGWPERERHTPSVEEASRESQQSGGSVR